MDIPAHTDPPCPAASRGSCSSAAPMLGVRAPAAAQVSPRACQSFQLTVPRTCTVPSTAFFCTKEPKEFWALWPELSSCTRSNDRGPGLQPVGNCSAGSAGPVCHHWGRAASPPWLTPALSHILPRCLCWLCCFPWCLCVPLTSTTRHIYGSKRPISVMFGDTRICSTCWKSGGLGEGRRHGFVEVPQEPAARSFSSSRAGHWSSPRPSSRPPVPPLLARHASLNFNSAEPHAGPQGNQAGMSINYLLNLDKYYNK